MTETQENASGHSPDGVASSPAEKTESAQKEQTHARLRPRVLRSGAANSGHLVSIAAAVPVATGLVVVGFNALPSGLILWIFAAALLGWTWLAVRAVRANRQIADVVNGGHVLPGQVESLSPDGNEFEVRWHCEIPALDADDPDLTIERTTRVSRWESRRYHDAMQVMVVFDPADPETAALFPPPGGGGGIDILGDCLAQLLHRGEGGAEATASSAHETTEPPPE